MKLFGSGILWGIPLADANGNNISNPSPIQFGILQDCAIDMSFDNKMLYGQGQFPVDIGRGKGKITGKAKFADINGMLMNSLFFGQTLTNASVLDYYDTTGSVSAASVTPVPPSSGTWAFDLGVRNNQGVPLTRVAASPAAGQYTVTAGVYTFASADNGNLIFISFQYTTALSTAKKGVVSNLLMGQSPSFRVDLSIPRAPKALTFTFYKAVSSKLSIATKQDDFIIPEFDFECFADDSNNVLTYSTSE